jgi:hypothetical protein
VSKKLPFVTSDIPRDLRSFLDRLRELVAGSGADRLLTANDLVGSGLATVDGSGNIKAPLTFVATPPAPTNVEATAAIRNIIVAWDNPAYVGHAHAEVWGSSTSSQSASVLLGMSPGAIYVDEVGPSVTRYYWVRFVNTNNTPGPYNALVGTSATTGSDVAYTLGLLSGQLTESELGTSLNSRINLIDGPATTTGTIPNQLALIQGQLDAINTYPEYDNATAYVADDIVKYNGGLYKALGATTGNLPTNAVYWLKIGDYSSLADVVAAHSEDISTLNTGLAGEVTARETLATQMRGTYSGTDIANITSGLLYSERTARASADEGLAGTISTVSATAASKNKIFRQATAPSDPAVNDIWVDLKTSYDPDYFSEDYSAPRYKQFQWTGTEWADITNTDISDNFALLTIEQLARATADEAFAQQITTLDTQVNDPETGLPATRATLINDYYTAVDVDDAIASSETTLRAYTDDEVSAGITTLETTQIGYCTIGGIASDSTNKTACEAAGGTWNVGIPMSTAVKQVSVSDGDESATLEQRFTAQKTLNDGLQAEYTIKLDVNGNVAGYGIYGDEGGSEFIANVDRFAVTAPQSSIALRATSTTYAVGAIARVAGQDSKTLVCKIAGNSGPGSIVVGNIGTLVVDGSVTWQVASRVPFAVQAVPTSINGQPVPAGVYIDAAYVLNATIQNAQIADLAVDDQKIASLNVGKLTAGSLQTDSYVQSSNYVAGAQGFRISANGNAEFQNAVVRGAVFATSGTFAGSLSAATGTFAGALSAATGTFSGDLSAATGTFTGGLNVKSATSGARMEIKNNVIKVFDANGVLRVKIGDLSA